MNTNFTQIPNEIYDALLSHKLNRTELAVAFHVLRKTFGWQKEADRISSTQFCEAIGASKRSIFEALRRLKNLNIINEVQNTAYYKSLKINRNVKSWKGVRKTAQVSETAFSSAEKCTKTMQGNAHTKEKKETQQKKWLDRLQEFWKTYPRQIDYEEVKRAFKELNPSEELFKTMLLALKKQKKNPEWKNILFVPYPAKWIRNKRWMDMPSKTENEFLTF